MFTALFQFLTVVLLSANHGFADILVQPGYSQPRQQYSPIYMHGLDQPTLPRNVGQPSNLAINPAAQTYFPISYLNHDQLRSHIVGNPYIRYRYIHRPPLHHVHTTRIGGYKILQPSWTVGHQYGPASGHHRYRRSTNDNTDDDITDENGDVAKKPTLAENSTTLIDSPDASEAADDSNGKRIEVRQSKGNQAMHGMFYNVNSNKMYPGYHKYRTDEIPLKSDDLSQEKASDSIPVTQDDQPKNEQPNNDLSKGSTSNESDNESRNVRSHHSATQGATMSQLPSDLHTKVTHHEQTPPGEKPPNHQNSDQVGTQNSYDSHQIPSGDQMHASPDMTSRNYQSLIYEDGVFKYKMPMTESQASMVSSPMYLPYHHGQRNFHDLRPPSVPTFGSSSMPMRVSIPSSDSMQQAHHDAARTSKMFDMVTPKTVENIARTHHANYPVYSSPNNCGCYEEPSSAFSCPNTCGTPAYVTYPQYVNDCGCSVATQAMRSSYRMPTSTSSQIYQVDDARKPRYGIIYNYGEYDPFNSAEHVPERINNLLIPTMPPSADSKSYEDFTPYTYTQPTYTRPMYSVFNVKPGRM